MPTMVHRFLMFLATLSIVLASCTSSRWVVVDQAVTDPNDTPSILSENLAISVEKEPSADDPTIRFRVQKIVKKELEKRVLVERTIQKYRPRWGVWALGLGGAVFAGTAANTSIINPDISNQDQLFLNITALITGGITLTQLKPVGESIRTGETQLMRQNGFEVVTDTLQSESFDLNDRFYLSIEHMDSVIVQESDLAGNDGTLSINLASVLTNGVQNIDENSTLRINVRYGSDAVDRTYPVEEFMKPYVVIDETVVLLRNTPVQNDMNVVAEVGSGSTFELIERMDNGWYRVLFGGSEVFIQKNESSVKWLSDAISESIDVFEFADVPFGDIDVENSVPVLRQSHPDDRSLIISNNSLSSEYERPYVDRDHQLFDFYMEAALQMDSEQRYSVQIDSTSQWESDLVRLSERDSTGLLYVYVSGTADIINSELALIQSDKGNDQFVQISELFRYFGQMNPDKLVIIADLEFRQVNNGGFQSELNTASDLVLQDAASLLQNYVPNSAIIFSNLPGQGSQLFAGGGSENKRHHIFTYYWAEALKNRNVTLRSLLNYLQRNVDYTSRRLHDSPQEIRAFGNLSISVRE